MNKKWTALVLALGLAAGMAGCGNPAAPSSRQAGSFRSCDGDHEALQCTSGGGSGQ